MKFCWCGLNKKPEPEPELELNEPELELNESELELNEQELEEIGIQDKEAIRDSEFNGIRRRIKTIRNDLRSTIITEEQKKELKGEEIKMVGLFNSVSGAILNESEYITIVEQQNSIVEEMKLKISSIKK